MFYGLMKAQGSGASSGVFALTPCAAGNTQESWALFI
jgi:hypothetical protein